MDLLLDISRALRAPGEEIPFQHCDEIPPQEIFGETVTFSDVVLTGMCSAADDSLRIRGELTATAHGQCALCLAPVDYRVKVPFDEIFTRQTRFTRAEDASSPDEEERLMYEGSKVELSHLAMTLAVLDLPIRFECEGDHDALSGALAGDTPSYRASQKDMPDQHPFSALQQLLTKDQEV